MSRIKLIQGDITLLKVDAIVNAANSTLMGGGGVDGAIHRAGGSAILEECRLIVTKKGECQTGEAVLTTGGNLPASFVIHTVGPIWDSSEQEKMEALLRNCYRNSLQLAVDNQLKTIAFPNISTGVYHFPKKLAAQAAVHEVNRFLDKDQFIESVTFVCFDVENFQLYAAELSR